MTSSNEPGSDQRVPVERDPNDRFKWAREILADAEPDIHAPASEREDIASVHAYIAECDNITLTVDLLRTIKTAVAADTHEGEVAAVAALNQFIAPHSRCRRRLQPVPKVDDYVAVQLNSEDGVQGELVISLSDLFVLLTLFAGTNGDLGKPQ